MALSPQSSLTELCCGSQPCPLTPKQQLIAQCSAAARRSSADIGDSEPAVPEHTEARTGVGQIGVIRREERASAYALATAQKIAKVAEDAAAQNLQRGLCSGYQNAKDSITCMAEQRSWSPERFSQCDEDSTAAAWDDEDATDVLAYYVLATVIINVVFLVAFLSSWTFESLDDNILMALSVVAITMIALCSLALSAVTSVMDAWGETTTLRVLLGLDGMLRLLYAALVYHFQLPFICNHFVLVCIHDSCVYPEEDKAARVKAEAKEKAAEANKEFRAEYAQIECVYLPAPPSDLDMSDEELETESKKCFHGIGEDEEEDCDVLAAARIGALKAIGLYLHLSWPSLSAPVYPTAPRVTHCAKIVTKQTALTDSAILESFDLSCYRSPTANSNASFAWHEAIFIAHPHFVAGNRTCSFLG